MQLAAVQRRYREQLCRSGRLIEFPLTGYDRTGIPVMATVWSDAAGDAHGVGYGRTDLAASVGALGEVAERVFAQQALADLPVVHGSYSELVSCRGHEAVADPLTLIVDADADYHADRPLSWVSAVRWRTGAQVLVPAEFAAFDRGSLPRGRPARTG